MKNHFEHPEADWRDTRLGSVAADAKSRTLIIPITPAVFESEQITISRDVRAGQFGDTRGPFWNNLFDVLSLGPQSINSYGVSLNNEQHAVTIRRNWPNEVTINFDGWLKNSGALYNDQVRMDFHVRDGGFHRLEMSLIEATDKELTRAVYELQQAAELEQHSERDWRLITWMIHASLVITKKRFEDHGSGVGTLSMAPHDTFYDTTRFIQWEWPADDEIILECVSAENARPGLTDAQVAQLVAEGWSKPGEGRDLDNPNFSMVIREPDLKTVARIFTHTLRNVLGAQSTDWMVVRPRELSRLLIQVQAENDEQRNGYPQGLFKVADIQRFRSSFLKR